MTTREKLARRLRKWRAGKMTFSNTWEELLYEDKRVYYREADKIIKLLKGGKK